MKPVEFEGANAVFGANQPEYLPLPAKRDEDGFITSCWELTLRERYKVFFGARIFVNQLTFGHPLQPQKLSVSEMKVHPAIVICAIATAVIGVLLAAIAGALLFATTLDAQTPTDTTSFKDTGPTTITDDFQLDLQGPIMVLHRELLPLHIIDVNRNRVLTVARDATRPDTKNMGATDITITTDAKPTATRVGSEWETTFGPNQ